MYIYFIVGYETHAIRQFEEYYFSRNKRYIKLLDHSSRRNMDPQTIPIILTCIGPLITLLIYQWKVNADTKKTLDGISLLLYDRTILHKLIAHLAMDDPQASAKERRMLEKRIGKIEGILHLLASKSELERIIDEDISSIRKE